MTLMGYILVVSAVLFAGFASWFARAVVWGNGKSIAYLAFSTAGGIAAATSVVLFGKDSPQVIVWMGGAGGVVAACMALAFAFVIPHIARALRV
jgi:hypothetical protein